MLLLAEMVDFQSRLAEASIADLASQPVSVHELFKERLESLHAHLAQESEYVDLLSAALQSMLTAWHSQVEECNGLKSRVSHLEKRMQEEEERAQRAEVELEYERIASLDVAKSHQVVVQDLYNRLRTQELACHHKDAELCLLRDEFDRAQKELSKSHEELAMVQNDLAMRTVEFAELQERTHRFQKDSTQPRNAACVVCLDLPATFMTVPCRHLAYCQQCVLQIRNAGGRCAVCQQWTRKWMKVFVP
eukprot:TRINITY_DN57736_c0_g1_i1.p1 TRINITY_DN57736_c0_g1~~TRINITY_DN57736_c0_g1_i1.p1  ORF type:complete len:248 (-),score=33.23 TRINITY_DN57736_c0_g1_i1:401-1144(-)